jgi:predicted transposase YdaD
MEIVTMSGLEHNPLIDYFIQKGLEKGLEKGREQGLEKGREQGLEKGLEKGREQGLEQGREEGLRLAQMQIAIRLATQRFGPLSLSVLSKLQTLPSLKLETLVDSLLDSKLHDLDSFIQALSS